MQINSSNQVSRIYHMDDAIAGNSTKSSTSTQTEALTDTVTISDAGSNVERKLQEVANKYDPTNMSHSELTRLSSELQLNGLITPQEGLAMRAPPSRGFDADDKYDVLALARKTVEFDQSIGTAQNTDAKLRANVLNVLESLISLKYRG